MKLNLKGKKNSSSLEKMRKGSCLILVLEWFLNILKQPMVPRHCITLTPVITINRQDINKKYISYIPLHNVQP